MTCTRTGIPLALHSHRRCTVLRAVQRNSIEYTKFPADQGKKYTLPEQYESALALSDYGGKKTLSFFLSKTDEMLIHSPKISRKLYVWRFTQTFISSGPQPLRGSRQAKSLIFGSLMIRPASFSSSNFAARAQRLPSWMFAAMGPEQLKLD